MEDIGEEDGKGRRGGRRWASVIFTNNIIIVEVLGLNSPPLLL